MMRSLLFSILAFLLVGCAGDTNEEEAFNLIDGAADESSDEICAQLDYNPGCRFVETVEISPNTDGLAAKLFFEPYDGVVINEDPLTYSSDSEREEDAWYEVPRYVMWQRLQAEPTGRSRSSQGLLAGP